jgi:hypothetical protein
MRAVARLTLRLSSFEIKALVAVSLLLSVVMIAIAVVATQSAPVASCFTGEPPDGCEAATFFNMVRLGGQFFAAMALVPIVVGGVLGSQVFAREIERGTAQFSWSMTSSRTGWFLERTLWQLLPTVVVVVLLAIASTVLESSLNPDVGAGGTLLEVGLRGPSLIARSVAVFSIAAVIGLVFGRTLPALLTAALAGAVIAVIAMPAATAIQPTEMIGILGDRQVLHGIVRDEQFIDGQGRSFTANEVTQLVPTGVADPTSWIEEHYQQAAVGIPGRKYWQVELTSTVELALLSVAALAVGAVIVQRRRPF